MNIMVHHLQLRHRKVNEINGTTLNDILAGLGGDDFIFAGDGDDKIYGDDGNDELTWR